MRIGRSTSVFAIALVSVLALDQITKSLVRDRLAHGQSWPDGTTTLGRFYSFTHVQNTGVAFGLFKDLGNVFLVTSILIVVGMLVYRRQIGEHLPWAHVAIGMIVAGALGNSVDRVTIGHVTDFFDFKFWPVFNVADASVFLGVLLLMSQVWRDERARTIAPGSHPREADALEASTTATEASDEAAPEAPASAS